MEIHLTVVLKSKEECIETFKSLLLDLVPNSKKEVACLQYDLHQSDADPSVFIFHETWKDQAGLDNHNKQNYLIAFFEAAKELLEVAPTVYRTSILA